MAEVVDSDSDEMPVARKRRRMRIVDESPGGAAGGSSDDEAPTTPDYRIPKRSRSTPTAAAAAAPAADGSKDSGSGSGGGARSNSSPAAPSLHRGEFESLFDLTMTDGSASGSSDEVEIERVDFDSDVVVDRVEIDLDAAARHKAKHRKAHKARVKPMRGLKIKKHSNVKSVLETNGWMTRTDTDRGSKNAAGKRPARPGPAKPRVRRRRTDEDSGSEFDESLLVADGESSGEEAGTGTSTEEEEDGSESESAGQDEEEEQVVYADPGEEEDVAEHAAKQRLAQCEKISARLRNALARWSSGQAVAARADEDLPGEEQGCLSLTELSATATDGLAAAEGGAVERPAGPGPAPSRTWTPVDTAQVSAMCPALELKSYQLVGLNWMLLLHNEKVSGVLADDMGLGKTVQSIAFFAVQQQRALSKQAQSPHRTARKPRNLVVVPASVLANWKTELARFAPQLGVVVYHGSQGDRDLVRGEARRGDWDVMLTTYSYFERESANDDRKFIKSIAWDYLVLDEAHALKNMKTARWTHLRAVESRQRLLLSGTPVQNNLRELLVLLDFLSPHVFKLNVRVRREWDDGERNDPIGQLMQGLGIDEGGGNSSGEQLQAVAKFRSLLAPFVLRRLKSQVLDQLSPKTTHVDRLAPTALQRDLYDTLLRQHVARAKRRALEARTKSQRAAGGSSRPDGSELRTDDLLSSERDTRNIFVQLRKAANHPLLVRHHYDEQALETIADAAWRSGYFGDECTLAMVRAEVDGYCDFDLHQLCVEHRPLKALALGTDALYASCKLERLRSLVPELLGQGHRILIFSQWTRLLDILELFLEEMSLAFLRLDGSTPVGERQTLINQFNADESWGVFLLSTRAGGLGINLTAADTVIQHDLDFNPVHDRQAEDRCHRIGQTKPVTVYKLVTQDTVDEKILNLGTRKSEVTRELLGDETAGADAAPALNTVSGILIDALKPFLDS